MEVVEDAAAGIQEGGLGFGFDGGLRGKGGEGLAGGRACQQKGVVGDGSKLAGEARELVFRLRSYDEVTSTNDLVKRALEAGEPEGLAISARVQTAGYGRAGRTWASPAGGMYVSLLLRPCVSASQLPTLSLMAGVAVRRAIAGVLPDDAAHEVKIKWPNDVVYSASVPFRKLAGISLESHAGGVCVGIGVNVCAPAEGAKADDRNAPTYVGDLAGCALGVDEVRSEVLRAFSDCYLLWCAEGFSALLHEFDQHSLLNGRTVCVEALDKTVLASGAVRGVDVWGRLLVEPAGSRGVQAVSSGEARVLLA